MRRYKRRRKETLISCTYYTLCNCVLDAQIKSNRSAVDFLHLFEGKGIYVSCSNTFYG